MASSREKSKTPRLVSISRQDTPASQTRTDPTGARGQPLPNGSWSCTPKNCAPIGGVVMMGDVGVTGDRPVEVELIELLGLEVAEGDCAVVVGLIRARSESPAPTKPQPVETVRISVVAAPIPAQARGSSPRARFRATG
jgi:hypothetical protein